MRVTGYTEWREGSKIYILLNHVAYSKELFEEAEKAVIEDIREHGYHFFGEQHQNAEYGVPILNGKYLFQESFRVWGAIMAEAYPDEEYGTADNEDGKYNYCKWAWYNSELESEIVIPSKDRILPVEEDDVVDDDLDKLLEAISEEDW